MTAEPNWPAEAPPSDADTYDPPTELADDTPDSDPVQEADEPEEEEG